MSFSFGQLLLARLTTSDNYFYAKVFPIQHSGIDSIHQKLFGILMNFGHNQEIQIQLNFSQRDDLV